MLPYLFKTGPRNLNLQNISNLNVVFLPQPISAALSTKYLHGVEDRLATDVATAACGMAQKPRHCVNQICQGIRKGTFPGENRPFRIGNFALSWRIRLRNNHVTITVDELKDVI